MEKIAPIDHPIHELIARRWSPRAFTGEPVNREQLLTLLEAARWAPSCFNEQPWRFLVATRDKPAAFDAMLQCLSEGNRSWAVNAAALLITVASTRFAGSGKHNRHAWHDVGLATALLSVQATALGLAVHPMAGFDAAAVRSGYGVPEEFEPVAAIAIGHTGNADTLPEPMRERERAPRIRKPLAELVYEGAWQERFSGLES